MNIFVAKLNFDTTSEDLQAAFDAFGEVSSAKVIMDRETGRSKGFGFVEMSDEAGAAAVEALDGYEHFDRNLRVSQANPREEK